MSDLERAIKRFSHARRYAKDSPPAFTAEPYPDVFLLLSEIESLRARVAEAARLLSWCQLHWSTYNYEGAPSAYFLSKIDAWLEPILAKNEGMSDAEKTL